MKLGDTRTITMGHDTPARASPLTATAAISLHLVAGDKERPLPRGELDALVGDTHTMTDRLRSLAERLTEAALNPAKRSPPRSGRWKRRSRPSPTLTRKAGCKPAPPPETGYDGGMEGVYSVLRLAGSPRSSAEP